MYNLALSCFLPDFGPNCSTGNKFRKRHKTWIIVNFKVHPVRAFTHSQVCPRLSIHVFFDAGSPTSFGKQMWNLQCSNDEKKSRSTWNIARASNTVEFKHAGKSHEQSPEIVTWPICTNTLAEIWIQSKNCSHCSVILNLFEAPTFSSLSWIQMTWKVIGS